MTVGECLECQFFHNFLSCLKPKTIKQIFYDYSHGYSKIGFKVKYVSEKKRNKLQKAFNI